MSVGLQRLRDEPERIRQGAIDKGEDPAVVDAALALDERRRALLSEGDGLKAERNTASKQVGEAIRGGASPDGPEVAALRAASTAAGERIAAIDAELAAVEAQLDDAMLRIPNPGRRRRAGRRRGGQRHGPDVGRAAAPDAATRRRGRRRCAGRRRDLGAAAALGDRARTCTCSTSSGAPRSPGSGFPLYTGARLPAPALAHQLVPRRPRDRERLHRGLAAGRRQRRLRPRDRPDPRQGRPDVRRRPATSCT